MKVGVEFTVVEAILGLAGSFVRHVIVKTLGPLMTTDCVPVRVVDARPGPDSIQLATCVPLHVMSELAPFATRTGEAVMLVCGSKTVIAAWLGGIEVPPGPVQVI